MNGISAKSMLLLYLNDVGGIRQKEIQELESLKAQGFEIEHLKIDWYTRDTFENSLNHFAAKTKPTLKQYKHVVLIGAGAGGSLAINIFSKLHERRLFTVTLCSRLNEIVLPIWDRRSLERVAYIGKTNESKLYFDSVMYCATKSIPKLSKAYKSQIITAHQKADPSMPRQTMIVTGIRDYKLSGFGHAAGITNGIRQLRKIIESCHG